MKNQEEKKTVSITTRVIAGGLALLMFAAAVIGTIMILK